MNLGARRACGEDIPAQRYGAEKVLRLRLVERLMLLHVVEELAAADVLHHDAEVRLREQNFFELHDERVTQVSMVHNLPSNMIGDVRRRAI